MSRSSSTTSHRGWLAIAVIAILVVADVAAIALALHNTRSTTVAVEAGAIPIFGAGASGDPSQSASPSASPTASPTARPTAIPQPTGTAAVRPTRIIAARDASTAWRTTTGMCPSARTSLQLSVDSGSTWTTTDATAGTGVTAAQRILVTGATSATLIGLAESDCSPQLVKASASGRDFADHSADLPSAWYLDPSTPGSVHSPAGTKQAPCREVIALAPRTGSIAAVLCSDHTVSVTTNGASTWSAGRLIEGALDITASALGYVVVADGRAVSAANPDTATPPCAGLSFHSLSSDVKTTTSNGCLALSAALMPQAGETAVSVAASTLWVWAGATVERSADGGATWK